MSFFGATQPPFCFLTRKAVSMLFDFLSIYLIITVTDLSAAVSYPDLWISFVPILRLARHLAHHVLLPLKHPIAAPAAVAAVIWHLRISAPAQLWLLSMDGLLGDLGNPG